MAKMSMASLNGSGKVGRGSGSMSQPAGGSAAVHDPGPKGKSPAITNRDVKAIGRLSGGRVDSRAGKRK